jgi:hypothetical protein
MISELKDKISQVFDEKQANVLLEIVALVYEQVLKAMDLTEVKNVIKDLAEAQKRTEESLETFKRETTENFNRVWNAIGQLTQRVDQLAEAQKRTEVSLETFKRETTENFNRVWNAIGQLTQRVDQLTQRMDQLTQRVDQLTQRMDQLTQRVDQLTQRMDQLTQRVDQLTQRMDQLAEAQIKTEEQLKELANAQKRVEEVLATLLGRMKTVEERMDWVFHSIGFAVEDKSLRVLPELLKKEGIEVKDKLIRRYYWIGDDYNQINIFGWGKKNGEKILILGEVKMRASKKEVDKFLKIAKEIQKKEGNPQTFLVFVASDFHPKVEEYLQNKGIRYFWSYELD